MKKRKVIERTKVAWAIAYRFKDFDGKVYSGFQGLYHFVKEQPKCVDGNRICLFRTRKIAREHLKIFRSGWVSPNQKNWIAKVRITIEEV